MMGDFFIIVAKRPDGWRYVTYTKDWGTYQSHRYLLAAWYFVESALSNFETIAIFRNGYTEMEYHGKDAFGDNYSEFIIDHSDEYLGYADEELAIDKDIREKIIPVEESQFECDTCGYKWNVISHDVQRDRCTGCGKMVDRKPSTKLCGETIDIDTKFKEVPGYNKDIKTKFKEPPGYYKKEL